VTDMNGSTPHPYSRRALLKLGGQAAALGLLAPQALGAAAPAAGRRGSIVGNPVAAQAGEKAFQEGGNAIDAAITAAFAATVGSQVNCGLGGYGGHAVIALAGGKGVTAVDFNSTAPAAAHPAMFPLDEKGAVRGGINTRGWLAAGVPGTLAGLELILTRFGTRSLRQCLQPAIALAEGGTHAGPVRAIDDPARSDRPGETLADRAKRRNQDLIGLLRRLATDNSTESFYHGDIAAHLAAAFQRHGGLVTRADLAAFRAREVPPLTLEWNGHVLHTAPLTATGALLLQASAALQALGWSRLSPGERLHAKLEALRMAWADRLRYWGDPEHVKVPLDRLLSAAQAERNAALIRTALDRRQPVPLDVDPSRAGGTVNLSAADREGNLIAITLTHGGGYGAQVVVDGLGLILGHGMSRFDPRPGLPNSPGPGKRPINNMCPTIVTKGGVPVLAAGGAGGTRIPNSLYEVLLSRVGLGASLDDALASPRLDTNGTLQLTLEKKHPSSDEAFFRERGYATRRGPSANISLAAFDPATGLTRGLSNGAAAAP
jgi:gamma-glutamyltranspeptidase/glutathione hydrolase